MDYTNKLAVLALTLTLAAGCTAANDGVDTAAVDSPATAAQPQAMPSGDMDAAEVQRGSATGTVTAIDPATSMVTIDHGAVPELEWPAMNMGFGATPAQAAQLQVGQSVEFDFEMAGNQATITRIEATQ